MENTILINEILNAVKNNKKYSSISDEIVLNEIKSYLKSNPKINHADKQLVKEIRAKLHLSYASFQTKHKNKIADYLKELKTKPDDRKITSRLLSITLSTKERINDYPGIYQKIFHITGKPDIIIDLGCGLNPFSYPLMNLKKLNYYAYDINEKDIDYLNEYFNVMKQKGITGKAATLDVKNSEEIFSLPSSDIIFLFKVIDILDKKNHKPSEQLIMQLFNNKKAKYLVASFATKTLAGKHMNHPRRKWFELMLERINLKFQRIQTNNEMFYVMQKNT